MSDDPTAPPPSYDEVIKEQQHQPHPIGFHIDNNPSMSYQHESGQYVTIPTNPYPHPQPNEPQIVMQEQVQSQQQPPPQQVLIMPNVTLAFGRHPSRLICPACLQSTVTRIEHESNCHTHTIAFLLCFFQFWCLSCLPYCIDTCKNTVHYCGNCGQYLGTHSLSDFH